MDAVMISIRPEWCEKILSGEKTIEIRKTKPKLKTPFKCYIYCTKDNKAPYRYGLYLGTSQRLDGKVVAEFACHNIENLFATSRFWFTDATLKQSCMTTQELHKYAAGNELYAWHISDLKVYVKPKELSEFEERCVTPGWICIKKLGKAPQSWRYVEKLKDESNCN